MGEKNGTATRQRASAAIPPENYCDKRSNTAVAGRMAKPRIFDHDSDYNLVVPNIGDSR